jgi:predicted dehydrogenase
MLKIGLMGCGTVADYGHLPAIKATPGMELVSLFEPDPVRGKRAREKFGGRWFDDAEAFFKSGIDVVSVTSPAPCHAENVLMAARHGKHVLCEKPLAMTDDEGEQMVSAMDRAGLKLYVGFTYRFSPVARQIKEEVVRGTIGTPRAARLVYIWDCHGKFNRSGDATGQVNERRHGRMLEGGPLVDCGVHQIDLARWWMDSEVTKYDCFGGWVDTEGGYAAPDHTWLHLDHANGAHTMVENSFSYTHTSKEQRWHYVFEVIGTKGVLRHNRDQGQFQIWTPTEMKTLEYAGEKNFEGMYEQFARAVRTGEGGLLASGRDGIIATRIAREATEIAMKRRADVTGQPGS